MGDYEQYGRRTSLRINGMTDTVNEDCLAMVKSVIKNLGVDLNDGDFDRAHRVGKPVDREGNHKKDRQMIVKFTPFRASTNVCRKRVKDEGKPRFYLHQTLRCDKLRINTLINP